jgi:hypothetical protein
MMAFLSRLVRVLGLLLLVRLVLRALVAPARTRRGGPAPNPRSGDLVLDEVCNTHVLKSRALRASIGGRECYFCSRACQEKALLLSRAS